VLLERLGHDLWAEASTLSRQGQVLVPLLQEAWRVPLTCGRPFQSKASDLLAILADLRPRYGTHHQKVLVVATEYAKQLAASETPEVVCHGDPHAGNVLRRGGGWAFIDPDGFIGERAYDLSVVMRDAYHEITAAEALQPGSARPMLLEGCRRMAEFADVDRERLWRWGFVERVTTGGLPGLVRTRPRISDLLGDGDPFRGLGRAMQPANLKPRSHLPRSVRCIGAPSHRVKARHESADWLGQPRPSCTARSH
jgi:hypothetical protein